LVVGVPKEIKDNENRVAVQPDGVAELIYQGNQVVVESELAQARALATPSTRPLVPRLWIQPTKSSPAPT
jgi:hypothetical protein